MNLAEYLTWMFLAVRMAVYVPTETHIPVSTREVGLWAGKFEAQNPRFRQIELSTGDHAHRKVVSPFLWKKEDILASKTLMDLAKIVSRRTSS